MGRQYRLGIWVLGITWLSAGMAGAAERPAAALEAEARAEFAQVGLAVRERLEREAAGDLIGARIAAQNADAHRYRFLDIERELTRLRAASLGTPSVEAERNPFIPDASFSTPLAPAWDTYPAWDMYRPHESRSELRRETADSHVDARAMPAEPPGRAGDMYSRRTAKPESREPDPAPTDESVTALPVGEPREPFLVYRERPAGVDPRD